MGDQVKMKSMFFFDFDDTLYSHKSKSVAASTQRALCELNRQGHILVIASGRGREAAELFSRELSFVPETLVFLNGQIIYQGDKAVYENHITMTDINELFDIARSLGIPYGGHYWDGVIANELTDRVKTVWTDFGSPMPFVCDKPEEQYPIYQAHLYITKEEQHLFGEQIKKYIPNWSHDYLVNLIHRSTGKSKAVNWCMKHYGIPWENTYAFGDGFNDVDMIEAVAHGIAMENGFGLLKEKAEYVTKSSDEDGIMHGLLHYGFLK